MFKGISRSYDTRGWAALDLLSNTNVKWLWVTLLLLLPGLCSSIGSGTKCSLARAFSQATRTASFAQSWNSASDIDTLRERKKEEGGREWPDRVYMCVYTKRTMLASENISPVLKISCKFSHSWNTTIMHNLFRYTQVINRWNIFPWIIVRWRTPQNDRTIKVGKKVLVRENMIISDYCYSTCTPNESHPTVLWTQ